MFTVFVIILPQDTAQSSSRRNADETNLLRTAYIAAEYIELGTSARESVVNSSISF